MTLQTQLFHFLKVHVPAQSAPEDALFDADYVLNHMA
ncbi:MAG: hypothetical protein JWN38_1019 [Candidatus Saccharibacteria bacterium]|nr:hypothetical protein [Candidatus Saccharibacteria bacterium]